MGADREHRLTLNQQEHPTIAIMTFPLGVLLKIILIFVVIYVEIFLSIFKFLLHSSYFFDLSLPLLPRLLLPFLDVQGIDLYLHIIISRLSSHIYQF